MSKDHTFNDKPDTDSQEEDEITYAVLKKAVLDSTSKAFSRMMDKRGYVVIFRERKLIKLYANGVEEVLKTE